MGSQARAYGFGVPWESIYGYSQAVQVGDTVHVSGQLSHDRDGTFVGAVMGVSDLALPDQLVETGALVRLDVRPGLTP
ncbi:hypothetical protein [Streptomyces sp. MB09-02B]|uniref:hypothetical protein n=1 Tax=Streptomyces sp. MB09-02B TaxID=3028667 RepID=UPI0029A88D2D|nr:hypothetical protein [Streptomyces sp. MB09-02B]MDX3641946.1 hypothetical protein [Streptomyces sp. MB09-02B]